ncbi:helix-turn-helix domain-containing protein [Paenibacillus montanisoli]|uniref:AraC family transcriptional regulator n=1 Tax=Paenibacillus montanisoli TaxID=2081970 RepID=A0A328U568_9BACL|nr:AraC family transcriptional regulator [Paenibacillus montanisoli]RAP76953.1 AraC family transcriptional regulator [Paenibacillus montanisoli]
MPQRYMENASHSWTNNSVRLILSPSMEAKSAFMYVQEVGYFWTHPPYFTERQHLPSYLVVYTVSGEGKLDYGGHSFTLGPHSLFFIDCMAHQHYRATGSEHWEFAWVHFYGGASRHYYDSYAKKGDPLLQLQRDSPVLGYMQCLIDLHEQKTVHTELYGAKVLTDLATELVISAHVQASDAKAVPAYLADMIREMERRCSETIRLDELARSFALSKYHLIREFKKHIGMSPNEYLIYLRIVRAKELLKYTAKPVAAIAEEVGVDNVSHFINLFKAREGLTPLAFRKKWTTASG